jgi:meiotic recombination protein REC8
MPWNLTASIRGSQAGSVGQGRHYASSVGGFPTSAGGPGSGPSIRGSLQRRISRLTSVSPLVNRGRESGLEHLSSLEVPEEDEWWLRGDEGIVDRQQLDEFELYGPVANVDTQTAEQTQWMKKTLDRESLNFLEFVKAAIESQQREDGNDEEPSTAEKQNGFVIFGDLLPPEKNTKIVAAQALIHTLSLATKNLITVQQDEGYGEIRFGFVVVL